VGRDPNVRRRVPSLHGSLHAQLRGRARTGFTNLEGSGRATMHALRYQNVRADAITVVGHVSRELPAPGLRVTAQADGIRVGTLDVGSAELHVDGGQSGYRISAFTSN